MLKAAQLKKQTADGDDNGENEGSAEAVQPETSVLMGGDMEADAKKAKKSSGKQTFPKQAGRVNLSTEFLASCNYRGTGLDLDGTYLQWSFSQKAALNGVHTVGDCINVSKPPPHVWRLYKRCMG